jgi:L-ascorbate 6-phosphate lactonase
MLACTHLGQSGFRLQWDGVTVYIDPYLSDSVARIEGAHLQRQVPIKIAPEKITDAGYVLITHIHLDHCDLDTLLPISLASPQCKFVGPNEVCKLLAENGIASERLVIVNEQWIRLGRGIAIHAIPAAHPVISYDNENQIQCVGYIIDFPGEQRIYHAGDTFLIEAVVKAVERFKPIGTAMLPVNEHNYFKEKQGIIGNMSMREAFGFASILGVEKFIPIHWDVFKGNAVAQDEIELYYKLSQPLFQLCINPTEI